MNANLAITIEDLIAKLSAYKEGEYAVRFSNPEKIGKVIAAFKGEVLPNSRKKPFEVWYYGHKLGEVVMPTALANWANCNLDLYLKDRAVRA